MTQSILLRSYPVFTSACSQFDQNDITAFFCRYICRYASMSLVVAGEDHSHVVVLISSGG